MSKHLEVPPLRRCDDCEHHLGSVLRALVCPRFGMPRYGVEIRCAKFEPKAEKLKAVQS